MDFCHSVFAFHFFVKAAERLEPLGSYPANQESPSIFLGKSGRGRLGRISFLGKIEATLLTGYWDRGLEVNNLRYHITFSTVFARIALALVALTRLLYEIHSELEWNSFRNESDSSIISRISVFLTYTFPSSFFLFIYFFCKKHMKSGITSR